MKLRLKENPREWQKFVAVIMTLLGLVSWLLFRKGVLASSSLQGIIGFLVLVMIVALVRPTVFRGFYRRGMTVTHAIGQVMGKLILSIFFVVVVTPLGLLLRFSGKDLLEIRGKGTKDSYWVESKSSREFDRFF